MPSATTKVCRKCLFEKPISEFSTAHKATGALKAQCRACESARVRAYYAAQPAYRAKTKENSTGWAKANPGKVALHRRKGQIKRAYGISPEQYTALLELQGNACALCGTTEHGHKRSNGKTARLPGGASTNWPIDHDHTTNAVRGLLCHACNVRLGGYEVLLRQVGEAKLLDYLTRPSPILSLPPPPIMEAPIYRRVAAPPPRYVQGKCTVCGEDQHAGGLCFKHYMRARRRNGDAGPAGALPHGGSTLTPDDIRAIRAAPNGRGSGAKLAAQYGVSGPTISMIRNNRIWTTVQ